jgi:hypothetical protein
MALNADSTKQKLHLLLSPKLSELGVLWRGDDHWVEPGDSAIHRIVRLVRLKGLDAVITWGVSLSLVPALSASRVVYHRTMRAARLDVFEWPQSYRESFSGSVLFARVDCRNDFFERSLTEYFSGIAPELAGWFERVRSIESIDQELERQVRSPELAYRLHHPSPAFVLAFVKAARGDLSTAERMLAATLPDSTDGEQLTALRLALARVPAI